MVPLNLISDKMKKYILFFAAAAMYTIASAQHTQTQSKTEVTTDKAMLDGKTFAVTLTENITGTTGTPGNVSDHRVENPEMTKRDMETRQPDKAGTVNNELKDKHKMLLRFESGNVNISGKGEIKNDNCPYKSWGMESTGISFSADCGVNGNTDKKNDKANASTVLTGTVNGDTVHGTMTCTKEDGSVKIYSYIGSKAGPNDLDMENEMGLR